MKLSYVKNEKSYTGKGLIEQREEYREYKRKSKTGRLKIWNKLYESYPILNDDDRLIK